MCKSCVVEPHPDRGTTTLEKGAYLLNYRGCVGCGSYNLMAQKPAAHQQEDDAMEGDEDVELVEFLHRCQACDHFISRHSYQFYVENGRQEYLMDCLLCGHGEASISVLPQGYVSAATPADDLLR